MNLGIPLIPLRPLLVATGIRAAQKTFTDIEHWIGFLRTAAEDCLSPELWLKGVLTPPGWTTISIVEYVSKSKNLEYVSQDLHEDVQIVVCSGMNNPNRSIQAEIGKVLRGQLDVDWLPLLKTRLTSLCPNFVFNYQFTSEKYLARLLLYGIEI